MPARAIAFAGGINLAEGAEPVAEGSSIAEFGPEKVLEYADEIDVYISQRGAMNAGGNLISIGERPGYETVKAVRDGRVYLINEKLISSPTFRFYTGVHEIARYLYPELLDDVSHYRNDALATKADLANLAVLSRHMPVYVPVSSSYDETGQKGHTYGLFADVNWTDDNFDYIETAVYAGCVEWERGDDGREYFRPDANVTRDELAKAIFVIGNFSPAETRLAVKDLDQCANAHIVQTLADNGVFELTAGCFEPGRFVTNQEILNALGFVH
jgi:iron complex transport system substrate-binding protein